MAVRAVSLDLDDTLWPVLPALIEAEHVVDRWLRQHHPDVANAWPIEAMRELREQIARDNTHLSHDFSEQRRMTIRAAFAHCGIDDAPVDELWRLYYAARNNVELYPDSLPALERIAHRMPIVSISNGNADLEIIGLHHLFHTRISAGGLGVAKPDPRIFLAAAKQEAKKPAAAGPSHTYKVSAGDTLYSIAKKNAVDVNQLRAMNGLKDNNVHAGQVLKVSAR